MSAIDTIKELLHENLDIDSSSINEATTLDSLEMDSLDMVELICNLEDKEDIDFGEPDQDQFKTLGDIVTYVDSLKE